jgi:hypothetical protein
MASKKTKTTNSADVNGVPTVTDVVTAAAGAEAPVSGIKLRWASLKPADSFAHRTNKTKGKKTTTPKTDKSAKANAATTDKLSAVDAAAKVLQEAGRPLNCQEMIQAMTDKGYWTSPTGKTPSATLYSAILRELQTKAGQARFQKTARGQFVYQNPQAS